MDINVLLVTSNLPSIIAQQTMM